MLSTGSAPLMPSRVLGSAAARREGCKTSWALLQLETGPRSGGIPVLSEAGQQLLPRPPKSDSQPLRVLSTHGLHIKSQSSSDRTLSPLLKINARGISCHPGQQELITRFFGVKRIPQTEGKWL